MKIRRVKLYRLKSNMMIFHPTARSANCRGIIKMIVEFCTQSYSKGMTNKSKVQWVRIYQSKEMCTRLL